MNMDLLILNYLSSASFNSFTPLISSSVILPKSTSFSSGFLNSFANPSKAFI